MKTKKRAGGNYNKDNNFLEKSMQTKALIFFRLKIKMFA